MESIGLLIQKVRNGLGVVSAKEFYPGEAVFRVDGVMLTLEEAALLGESEKSNTFRFSETEYISPKGKIGDFLNHSCDPNAYVRKENGELFVVALSSIKPGEEVTIDYSTILAKDDFWEMECDCGSVNCRKIVQRFVSLGEQTKEKYRKLGAVPEYID